VRPPQVSVLDGSTFAVSDQQGDMTASDDQVLGLFFRDMRHLSDWRLTINGRLTEALSDDSPGYDSASFFLVLGTGTVYRNPTLSVIRKRRIGDGLHEDLLVINDGAEPIHVELSVLFDADFADVFAVKDHLPGKGRIDREVHDTGVRMTYRRDDFVRETHIRAHGAMWTDQSMSFWIQLEPHQTWRTEIDVELAANGHHHGVKTSTRPNMGISFGDWVASAPTLESDWDDLRRTYQRSITDLAALRFYPEGLDGASLPAAGLPWFMALFGRDSLITSYQALPFVPELAATTLRALASRQAQEMDDFRDAEPGKILHELRFGEMTYFQERPQSPYYGSADSTPLFLILLDEYERWSGDAHLVRELEPAARDALQWLDEYGDRDGDGYQEYERRNKETGLENQCWKDSWNSIVHPDGSLASTPRATCELQGYVYDARRRCARLARDIWGDPALADRLDEAADELKRRFNTDFWVAAGGYFALALDGEKNQVSTLCSNMGHLLWSGIVDDERVPAVVDHLMSEAMFSGWGVRTLADGQVAYNPIEYHNGTVWPHDNALIAAGLARYGRHEQAAAIASAILEAAAYFSNRLPETFAGFARHMTGAPVEYPSACSPQAWATGTPLLLLRVLLGLEPEGGQCSVDPHVPEQLGRITLRGIPGRWGRSDASTSG
jgi:glycogen debranching enzyme